MAAGSLRVLHVGNLCNCAYNACVFLRRMGVEAHLLLRPDEWQPSHEEGHTIDNDWITLIHPPFLSAENGIPRQVRKTTVDNPAHRSIPEV